MYNNIYSAGFYPQIGMAQGFMVNQVPPMAEHAEHLGHISESAKITGALEGLAAVGTAAVLYKATKGRLHNVKTPAQKAAKQGAKKAAEQVTEQAAGQPVAKEGLLRRILRATDIITEEAKPEAAAVAEAAAPAQKGFLRKVVEAPFKAAWAIVTAPFKAVSGVWNWLKKAPKAESEVIQNAHTPAPAVEHIAEDAKLAESKVPDAPEAPEVPEIPRDPADVSTEAMPIQQPEAQQ